jgi:hypothetical protein
MTDAVRSERIAELNDRFRKDPLRHGRLMITAGVRGLGDDSVQRALRAIAEQDDIPAGNDPYGERDFAAFDLDGARIFWKIDLYEKGDVKHRLDRASRVRRRVDALPPIAADLLHCNVTSRRAKT